jgi:hypothetical protein
MSQEARELYFKIMLLLRLELRKFGNNKILSWRRRSGMYEVGTQDYSNWGYEHLFSGP